MQWRARIRLHGDLLQREALFEVFPHRRKKDPEPFGDTSADLRSVLEEGALKHCAVRSVLGVDPQRLAAIAESAEDSEKEAINAIELPGSRD